MFSLALIGCSSVYKKISDNLPSEIYAAAQQKLQKGNWREAITHLEILHDHYPLYPCFQQVQLDLIYAYYKNFELSKSKTIIDRFMRLNPTHPNIDYVIYIRGVINMELDDGNTAAVQHFFGINPADRDQQHVHDAFNDFFKLVQNYPASQYTADAVKRLIFLKNRLAEHEYLIASHYTYHGAWIAVVNRIEEMLRNYSDTQATRNGLQLMKNAYRQLKINDQADKVTKIIEANRYR